MPVATSAAQGFAGKEAALVATQPAVLAAASRALGGDRTPQQLQSDLTATAEQDINAVSVEAKADTADGAARIANAVAAAMVQVTFNQQLQVFQSALPGRVSPAGVRNLRARAMLTQPLRVAQQGRPPGKPDLAQAAA